MTNLMHRLKSDTSGAALALFAMSGPALVGATALAVDLGSLYVAERQLQGLADAAAAAAVSGVSADEAFEAATLSIAANDVDRVSIRSLETGGYLRVKDVAINERFSPTAAERNAVRIKLSREVPLFFGSFITGTQTNVVHAQSIAARQDMIAFDIGSSLIATNGIANQVLSGLAGVQLGLTADQVAAIAAAPIDVIDFADRLRELQEVPTSTFGAAFDRTTDIGVVVRAMAAATTSAAAREALLALSYDLENAPVTVSDVIDLGPLKDLDINGEGENAVVDAYSLLRNFLEATHDEGYAYSISIGAGSLANVTARIAGGQGVERSPWLTLSSAYDVVLRTAETRVGLTASVASPVGAIRVPIYAELAAAEARVSSVECRAPNDEQTASLGVTPSLAELAIADLDGSSFTDMTSDLAFKPARFIDTALIKVEGSADVALGGSTEHEVEFTREDIDDGVRKVVGTDDILQTAAASMIEDISLQVRVLGLGLGSSASAISAAVGTALTGAAPALDGLIDGVTNSLGVRLGAADVGVIDLKCGRPTIVA